MKIIHERIDDIPLIIKYLQKRKVDTFIDAHFKNHGNQNNLSNGEIAILWLSYILSEGDHRKVHVREWISSHYLTLCACLGKQIDVNNFSDDRLTRFLHKCSLDESWKNLENDLARETLSLIPVEMFIENYFEKQALNVIKGAFKLESTSISGYHEVTPDGIMQYGYSKDERPDPQMKIMICSEGISGCPLITEIDQGNLSDECMYGPVLKKMRGAFNTNNFLYCGDSKMSIARIRADIVINNEFYLCPLQLSNSRERNAFNEKWVKDAIDGSQALIQIYDGEEHYGYGYEFIREEKNSENTQKWHERVLLVKSFGHFEGEKKRFEKKVDKILNEISKLKSKICKTAEEAQTLLETHLETQFAKLTYPKESFEIEIKIEEVNKTYERSEVRKGGKRSGSYTLKNYKAFVSKILLKEECREDYLQRLGWRAFVSNIPSDLLNFSGAYCYYRKTQYVIENGFHMFKGKPIGIAPLHVWREDQVKGLLRFLSLGVLFLKLLSLELMIGLREGDEALQGLTGGQPKRKTKTPTAVSILSFFYRSYITLSFVQVEGNWKGSITPLPPLALKILNILGLKEEIYAGLVNFNVEICGLEK